MAIRIRDFKHILEQVVWFWLFLALTITCWAIDVHRIKVYGTSVDMPLTQIDARLAKLGFQQTVRPSTERIPGAEDHLWARSNGDQLVVVTLKGKLLLIKPRAIQFKEHPLRLGDSEKKLLSVLGKPQRRSRLKEHEQELAFNDEEHLVPLYVRLRGSTIIEFQISPGPDDPG